MGSVPDSTERSWTPQEPGRSAIVTNVYTFETTHRRLYT